MAGFEADNNIPRVTRPPFFASGTVTNGANTTITFANVTEQIIIDCTSDSGSGNVLLIGVTTAGVAGTARVAVTAGGRVGPLDVQCKQIVLAGGGGDMGYQITAVLSRIASDQYPDITTANGFEGV